MRLHHVLIVLAGAAAGAGCSADQRVTSTGTVSFDGRPIEKGAIVFRPLDPGVAPAGAAIAGGRFRIAGRPGRQRVEIRGTRPIDEARIPRTMPRMGDAPVYEDYVPAAFNAQSTLEVEVTAGGPNEFTFDLKSGPR